MFRRLRIKELNKSRLKLIGLIILLIALPLILLAVYQIQNSSSRAALPDQLETESGVLSSSGVSKQSDSGASGGQFIRFAKNTTGPSPTPSQGGYGPRGSVGPRYDFYDGQPGGNFPTLGVLEGASGYIYGNIPRTWNASNVRIVPDSVYNSSDVGTALGQWLSDPTKVPNGESATNPTFVIFDRSQNGTSSTNYDNGTRYVFSSNIVLLNPAWNVVRRNIVLWGYNTYLDFSNGPIYNNRVIPWSVGMFSFFNGGWENIHVVGFRARGPGKEPTSIPDMRTTYPGDPEALPFVDITSWSGFKVLDNNYSHASQIMNIREWHLGYVEGYPTNHYDGWSHGPYSNNAEIGWNENYASNNQGWLVNAGRNIDFHHNRIHHARQSLGDMEEGVYNLPGHPNRRVGPLTVRDNYFGYSVYQSDLFPNMIQISQWTDNAYNIGVDIHDNFRWLYNHFDYGPVASGVSANAQPLWNAQTLVFGAAFGFFHTGWPQQTYIEFRGNRSTLKQEYVDLSIPHPSNTTWGVLQRWDKVIIEDNDFQGMDWKMRGCPDVTWNNNGNSTYLTW